MFLILTENPDFLLIYKNSGFSSEEIEDNIKTTLNQKYTLCHRIDKYCSGIMIVSKHDESYESIKSMFVNRSIFKVYICVIDGFIPIRSFFMKGYIVRVSNNRFMFSELKKESVYCKDAYTSFQVLCSSKKINKSALLVRIHSGRTHQIRAQIFHMGFSIIGEQIYSRSQQIKDRKQENKIMLQSIAIGMGEDFFSVAIDKEIRFYIDLIYESNNLDHPQNFYKSLF